ncbi:MAG: hypothetical protein DRP42_06270, partial [Tenericutes bacterium]
MADNIAPIKSDFAKVIAKVIEKGFENLPDSGKGGQKAKAGIDNSQKVIAAIRSALTSAKASNTGGGINPSKGNDSIDTFIKKLDVASKKLEDLSKVTDSAGSGKTIKDTRVAIEAEIKLELKKIKLADYINIDSVRPLLKKVLGEKQAVEVEAIFTNGKEIYKQVTDFFKKPI